MPRVAWSTAWCMHAAWRRPLPRAAVSLACLLLELPGAWPSFDALSCGGPGHAPEMSGARCMSPHSCHEVPGRWTQCSALQGA